MRKIGFGLAVAFMTISLFAGSASAYDRPERAPAIVLAAFGTTHPEAVDSILNVKRRVERAFPNYEVRLAFTSNFIRNVWHKRANDAEFKKENPAVPAEVYDVKSALTTLAELQENGGRLILVQSLHITDGEEYKDLANLVHALENCKTMKRVLHPFPWIGIGDPALGLDDGASEKRLRRAADAIAPLAKEAELKGASLVLMGHGNEHLNQSVYSRLEKLLRERYGKHVYIGTVEAAPMAEDVVEAMNESGDAPKQVLLAPMMVVAGDHAHNDMAGDDDDSWASVLRAGGFLPTAHLKGLGSNDSWADIYVEHLKELEKTVTEKKNSEEKEKKK